MFKINNYLLTYDSYGPAYNKFHRGEWITWASGGEGTLDTPGQRYAPGPLNGTSEAMGKNQDPGSGINIPDPQHWYKLCR